MSKTRKKLTTSLNSNTPVRFSQELIDSLQASSEVRTISAFFRDASYPIFSILRTKITLFPFPDRFLSRQNPRPPHRRTRRRRTGRPAKERRRRPRIPPRADLLGILFSDLCGRWQRIQSISASAVAAACRCGREGGVASGTQYGQGVCRA
jgi:hypothetical protein